jgi:hypothetical protein
LKIVFIVYNDVYNERLMQVLTNLGIDYYTRWEQVKGKGHGTDAHLGTRVYPGLNAVLMIAFQDHELLEEVIRRITELNNAISRPDDKIRLFQVPLERIV